MRPVVIDFETYFADDYTLSKMTTEAYIRDPRFEAHGAAIKWDANTSAQWYDERELRYILKEENWSDVFLIHHHAQFDGLILSHHFDVHPAMFGCTLSMARLLLGNHISVSLDSVRKHFGMPAKTTPYHLFRGKHWNEISGLARQQIGEGAIDEVESIWKLFYLLMQQGFPVAELDVVDSIVKMFTEPVLELDTAMLAQLWESEATRKINGTEALGISAEELNSSNRFCELLIEEGIDIEYKNGKNNPIPAIAKNDPFMRDYLLEHDNPRVRALAEARLAQKSTLLQTRAETLGWVASRGPAPVYLHYSGAGTLRPSGGDGCNWLNFKRGSPIRRAVKAPQGFYLAPVDASQIECRVLHYLAGGPDDPVIQKFRNDEDPYVDLASHFYQEQIYKPKPDDPRKAEMEAKRGMGKQGRLMCCALDTQVLTKRGWIAIQCVRESDIVWDGIEWVSHQGLIYQGERIVENYSGARLTSDHPILCGNENWLPAAFLQSENILSLALESGSASLPLQATNWEHAAASLTSSSNVCAEPQNIRLTPPIFSLVDQRDAGRVPQSKLDTGARNFLDTLMCVLINLIDIACCRESRLFTHAATNKQLIKITPIMVGEEFAYISLGSKIKEHFWLTWLRLKGGMIRSVLLTESKIIKAMRPVTCDSPRQNNKLEIGAGFAICKKLLPTYDLSCAGPRSRFTILSARGPIIVHNCGYGASGKQFKATAASGQYGPRVDMEIDEADAFVAMYRQTNQPITGRGTGYWAQCERMLARLAGGEPIQWGPLLVKDQRIWIQGAPMLYNTIEYHTPQPEDESDKTGWRVKKRDGWRFIWGSKLTQNICEGVSRMIVSQAMIRIKKKYGIRTLNWPYDELLLLIPRNGREEEMLQLCIDEMTMEPSWLPGIPLAAEGALGERYEK